MDWDEAAGHSLFALNGKQGTGAGWRTWETCAKTPLHFAL